MSREHWEEVYRTKDPTLVSWYQPQCRISLDLIHRVAPDPASPIIDVGGGPSTLVDGLLGSGFRAITVLDLAPSALGIAQARLGSRSLDVTWIPAGILDAPLSHAAYAVWHDRAVFHFLTDPDDRARYVRQVRHAVRPGGHVIVASFAPDGPARCSGLDVMRYTPESMHREFGTEFRLIDSTREEHRTPAGGVQPFVYCICRRQE